MRWSVDEEVDDGSWAGNPSERHTVRIHIVRNSSVCGPGIEEEIIVERSTKENTLHVACDM